MMGSKEIPNREDLIDFNYAVAGHAGTLSDVHGELFIKPCVKSEIDFYQAANERHQGFADLMPTFMGMLRLNDATEVSSMDEALPALVAQATEGLKAQPKTSAPAVQPAKDNVTWVPTKGKKIVTDEAVVLENATYGFKQPNILDVKMGVRLWADDAPLEKKKRFDKISSETTHKDLGFRIAGMRVYRGSADESELNDDLYKIYDKDYGRVHVNTKNVGSALRQFLFNDAAGIDDELAKAVARAFLVDLRRVRLVLESEESRMYSSSLLFVFEGDGDALRAAIDENNALANSEASRSSEKWDSPTRSNVRVDSGIGMEEDDELTMPKIYTLKLIDFAHAEFCYGKGPDENVLKGVRSLIKIFEEFCE